MPWLIGIGIALFLLIFLVYLAVALLSLAVAYWPISIGLVALGIAIYLFSRHYKEQKAHEKARRAGQEAQRRRIHQHNANQESIRRQILTIVSSATGIARKLPEEIRSAQSTLDRAEEEFEDRAFAPFWDAVETAVTHLAYYDQGIQTIAESSNGYRQQLAKLESVAPPFELGVEFFPDAIQAANRLRNIVRLAQRDFQFATIYEQRKTNQLLVSGFANLGEALRDIGDRLEFSIDMLSGTLSDSITYLERGNREASKEVIAEIQSLRDHLKS